MSTTINSACWPFAVCAITHGSILFAVALAPPCPVAREEPFAANAAIPAATKNNEQNMRRNEDGVNVVSGGGVNNFANFFADGNSDGFWGITKHVIPIRI